MDVFFTKAGLIVLLAVVGLITVALGISFVVTFFLSWVTVVLVLLLLAGCVFMGAVFLDLWEAYGKASDE